MAPAACVGLPFVLPYLPFLIAFGIAPTIYALDLAFTDVGGGWVGFHNFTRTYHDFRFVPAFKHVLVYTCVWLAALMVFVVGLALLLHGRANRVSATFRFLFYIPGALAGAAAVLVWLFMLDPTVSPGSFLLHDVLGADIFAQSIAPGNLPFIFAMIAFWTGAGGWIVVMYGALNTIPPRPRGGRAHRRRRADRDRAPAEAAADPQVDRLHADPLLRDGNAALRRAADRATTRASASSRTRGRANQLAYQMAFRYADFNGAAAIAVDLLAIGLVGAVLIVTRSGLFRTED